MWNFGYHLARARGALIRNCYHALLPAIVRQPIANENQLPVDVFSYSGKDALPEQVASARSFLKFAGRPASFTIVSDGSYSDRCISLLQEIDPVIRVVDSSDFVPDNVSSIVRQYFSKHATGKQLAVIFSLPRERPALYFDSDVLFFRGARALAELVRKKEAPALYLPDCQFAGDDRLLRDESERMQPVNTGALILFERPDWSKALQRFHDLSEPPNFFTNQTLTHLALHASGAQSLDPQKFVLQLDDQFILRDAYARSSIALRHYVNPVRHKFWSSLFR